MSSGEVPPTDATGRWLIPAEALPHDIAPGSGVSCSWGVSPASELPMATSMFDVVLEPNPPIATQQVRFGWSPIGPFLYQSVRAYADADQPAQVVEKLKGALRTSTTIHYDAYGSKPAADLTVTEVDIAQLPSAGIAWKTTPVDDDSSLVAAPTFVLIPRTKALIQFEFVDVTGRIDPDPILVAAVKSLEELDSSD